MAGERTLKVTILGDSRGAQKALADLNDSADSAGDKLGSAGRKMTLGLTLPIVGIAAAGVKTAGEFEKSMNTMEAVAGVPGPELEKLRKLAIKMGADTAFSANDAAGSMLELSKAGVSTADIMGGGLKNTMSLAQAGGLELAEAATVASNAMNVFGLSGKDSQQAVDALAGAANASSADVADLALALSQGGLAAAAAGFSVQETTAALAAFADAGLKGSDAGTSLKTFLLSLVPTTEKPIAAMKELGLSFVDSKGNIKSLTEIAGELQSKMKGLTQEQQQVALKTIFGTDAYRAAHVILKEGAGGLQKYLDATSKVGTASDVAKARMKGWAGVIETLKGSIETVGLTIGDALIPVLSKVGGIVNEVAQRFISLPKGMQGAIIVVGLAVAALGPLLSIFGALATAIAFIASPIGLVVVALAALAAAVVFAYKHSEAFREVIDRLVASVGERLSTMAAVASEVFARIKQWLSDNQATFEEWGRKIGDLFAEIAATVGPALDAVVAIVTRVVAVISDLWDRFGNQLVGHIRIAAESIMQVISGALEALRGIFNVFAGIFTGDWSRVWEGIQQIFGGVWNAVVGVLEFALNSVSTLVGGAMAVVSSLWSAAWNSIRTFLGDILGDLVGSVSDRFNGIVDFVADLPGRIRDAARGMFDGIAEAFKGAMNVLVDAWNSLDFGIDISVPDWVPGVGGKGFKVDDIFPDIPRLAGGAFARARPGGMFANIAEGGQDEIVSPVPMLRQIVRQESGGGGVTINVNVAGSVVTERELVLAVREGFIRMQRRMPLGFG